MTTMWVTKRDKNYLKFLQKKYKLVGLHAIISKIIFKIKYLKIEEEL